MLTMWFQSDESVYERECGNMPGFAVYYRYPNSQRVTYGQFIKVSFKRFVVLMVFLSSASLVFLFTSNIGAWHNFVMRRGRYREL